MQQEDEEDERADQNEAGIRDEAIPAGDHDEPMRRMKEKQQFWRTSWRPKVQ